RAALAKQYNSLLTQIDQLAKDSSFNGTNLLSSSATTNKLHISFNEKDTSNLDVQGVDATSVGLSLTAITGNSGASSNGQGNFLIDNDVKTTLTSLTNASSTLRSQASTFGSNLSVVQNRQDFTKNLQNVLDTGASKLTDADLNEEAANSQALSTRQSLGISALSLANQAQQGVLQLLR
ncbi:MAG: flagellar protein, partial [Alphaproteobacteria bacterium]